MVRRRAPQAPLASTFVSVLEPYEKTSRIRSIRRLKDPDVVVDVELLSGEADRWRVSGDTLVWVRRAAGIPARIALCHTSRFEDSGLKVNLRGAAPFVELELRDGRARVVGGDARQVASVIVNGRPAVIENSARK
jgi:hypothetical protein